MKSTISWLEIPNLIERAMLITEPLSSNEDSHQGHQNQQYQIYKSENDYRSVQPSQHILIQMQVSTPEICHIYD